MEKNYTTQQTGKNYGRGKRAMERPSFLSIEAIKVKKNRHYLTLSRPHLLMTTICSLHFGPTIDYPN